MTTVESVRASVESIAAAHAAVTINHHRYAMPWLGENEPLGDDSEASTLATAGTVAGGANGRARLAPGIVLIGGASYGRDRRAVYRLGDLAMIAGAVRVVRPLGRGIDAVVMLGGWYADDGEIHLARTYANGAGTATAPSTFHGRDHYLFTRAGLVFRPGGGDEFALTGEVGAQRWRTRGFAETDGNANPFPAIFAPAHGRMDVAKARAQWSHRWGSTIDTTFWGARAWTFDGATNSRAAVAGAGIFAPRIGSRDWTEYGGRIGLRLSDRLRADLFANGLRQADANRAHVGLGLRYRF